MGKKKRTHEVIIHSTYSFGTSLRPPRLPFSTAIWSDQNVFLLEAGREILQSPFKT